MKKIGLFCASSNDLNSIYYDEAARLGAYIGQQKKTLVYGGNAKGLMEATAKAVSENGGNVMGIIPKIIYDRGGVSRYVSIEVPCNDLTDRKQLLLEHSDILIAMPGSVGTLEKVQKRNKIIDQIRIKCRKQSFAINSSIFLKRFTHDINLRFAVAFLPCS